MGISVEDFVHPLDEEARRNLEAIPGFSLALKMFMKTGIEKFLHGINMANKIRLSPTQLPHIYNLLPPICSALSIDEPEFYLEMNPIPNAYTTGDSQTAITLTSGLVEYLTDEELVAVVAHECGHIVCHHVLYHTMGQIITNGISGFTRTIAMPIKLGLLYWMRCSELSCDRVSAIVSGNSKTIVNVMIRLAGGPRSITETVNIEEYAAQANEYEILLKSKYHNMLQSLAVMERDHPFLAVRVNEILKWTNSYHYKQINYMRKIKKENHHCPSCNALVSTDWMFCKNCGSKIN